MDLDALSGVIAYKHTGESVTTVTAAFDRIAIAQPLHEICDLELSGMVTYASGRSSMEISLQVARAPKPGEKVKPEDVMISAKCTMVSLDPRTKKPVNVPALRTDTEEEKRLYAEGERNSGRSSASDLSSKRHRTMKRATSSMPCGRGSCNSMIPTIHSGSRTMCTS